MIMAWLMPFKAFLKNIPAWVWVAIIAALIVAVAYHKGHSAGQDSVRAEYAEIARKAAEAARKADAAAGDAVETTKTEVEKTNDEARKAAVGSNDPLKSAFDSLRR